MFRRPWVNYAIIAATVICSIVAFYDEDMFEKWSGVEGRYSPLLLSITSTFLHAGWLHLAGNMLFLWIFGNAMNYKFGHVGYLVFYLFGAFASGIVHYACDGRLVVGASGAINAVMGAFLVFFPRNDITVFWLIWVKPGVSRLSSMWVIIFWIAWDVLYLMLGVATGVALWSHVGGFVCGFAVAILLAFVSIVKPTQDEQTLLQVFARR